MVDLAYQPSTTGWRWIFYYGPDSADIKHMSFNAMMWFDGPCKGRAEITIKVVLNESELSESGRPRGGVCLVWADINRLKCPTWCGRVREEVVSIHSPHPLDATRNSNILVVEMLSKSAHNINWERVCRRLIIKSHLLIPQILSSFCLSILRQCFCDSQRDEMTDWHTNRLLCLPGLGNWIMMSVCQVLTTRQILEFIPGQG